MATPPTLRNFSKCSNPTIAGTSKTLSLTCSAGDYLVFFGIGEDISSTLATPTGGSGLVWTLNQSVLATGDGSAYLWTCQASSANTAATITVAATGGSTKYDLIAYVWDGSTSAGIGNTAKANSTTSAAPACSITTTAANSALCCAIGDFNASAITTRTWRTINGVTPTSGNLLETEAVTSAGSYTAWSAYWTDAGAAGATTTGMTAPATQAYSIVSAEILPLTSTGSPTAPITGRPGLVRPGPGAAVTLDHGVVIQAAAPDIPQPEVPPTPASRPSAVGSVLLLGPRTDPGLDQPVPGILLAGARPAPAAGTTWTTTLRPADGPIEPPAVLVGRTPQPAASAAWTLTSRADPPATDQPAPYTVQSSPQIRPAPGSAAVLTPRTDPDATQNQPAPEVLTVTPAPRPAAGVATLTSARAADEPPPAKLVQLGTFVAGRPGTAVVLASRADLVVTVDQPGPAVLVTVGRQAQPGGSATVTTTRADPAPTTAWPTPAVISSPTLPAGAGSVQLLRSVAEVVEAAPVLLVAAWPRLGAAGATVLTRATYTPPPPVLHLRPPIQSPGIRLADRGSGLLLRLTEFTGHICPPPTARPDTGTTTTSAGDVTPRPYSGVTPVC
jgi:hypothetical protein